MSTSSSHSARSSSASPASLHRLHSTPSSPPRRIRPIDTFRSLPPSSESDTESPSQEDSSPLTQLEQKLRRLKPQPRALKPPELRLAGARNERATLKATAESVRVVHGYTVVGGPHVARAGREGFRIEGAGVGFDPPVEATVPLFELLPVLSYAMSGRHAEERADGRWFRVRIVGADRWRYRDFVKAWEAFRIVVSIREMSEEDRDAFFADPAESVADWSTVRVQISRREEDDLSIMEQRAYLQRLQGENAASQAKAARFRAAKRRAERQSKKARWW
ncbi:hypothetical protein MMC13_003293 [Lambiella insularis]|nr:hypothetical protein [Lambiella insularis]